MKISFNRRLRRHEAWGGGSQFLTEMYDYLVAHGHTVLTKLEDNIDVIFMLDPRPEEDGYSVNDIAFYKYHHPSTKVIHRINDTDIARGTNFLDEMLLKSNAIADETIFISEWIKTYYTSKGFNKSSHVIYNGCNPKYFYPNLQKSKPTTPIKLVTHHWSNNPNKGSLYYQLIDEYCQTHNDIEFTYIGRYWNGYQPKATTIIQPLCDEALGNALQKNDVYVTAAKFEACGMHHIEGAACGLPVLYHQHGGGVVDVCKNHGVSFSNMNEFFIGLKKISEDYDVYRNMINYQSLTIDTSCQEYLNVIEGIMK